jgi:RNA polymerase sigma-70 factor, ECF subfamily
MGINEREVNPMGRLDRSQVMAKQSPRSAPVALELVDLTTSRDDDADERADAARLPEPFDSFYRREFPRLVALAHALAGPAQAADIAQEAMIVAYGQWDEVRSYTSPAGWVRGVCSHKAVSVVRRFGAETRALARLRLRRPPPIAADTTDDEPFWQAVRELPRRQAQVAALHYALDLSVADIAVTLDCAEGTVKAHLFRARAALADRLRPDEEGSA